MDADRSWRIIEQQRLAIADLLDGLSAEQWQAPSLCAGWRVRDVAAHVSLVGLPPTPGDLLVQGIKVRGNFHRLNTAMSVRRAARPKLRSDPPRTTPPRKSARLSTPAAAACSRAGLELWTNSPTIWRVGAEMTQHGGHDVAVLRPSPFSQNIGGSRT